MTTETLIRVGFGLAREFRQGMRSSADPLLGTLSTDFIVGLPFPLPGNFLVCKAFNPSARSARASAGSIGREPALEHLTLEAVGVPLIESSFLITEGGGRLICSESRQQPVPPRRFTA